MYFNSLRLFVEESKLDSKLWDYKVYYSANIRNSDGACHRQLFMVLISRIGLCDLISSLLWHVREKMSSILHNFFTIL